MFRNTARVTQGRRALVVRGRFIKDWKKHFNLKASEASEPEGDPVNDQNECTVPTVSPAAKRVGGASTRSGIDEGGERDLGRHQSPALSVQTTGSRAVQLQWRAAPSNPTAAAAAVEGSADF